MSTNLKELLWGAKTVRNPFRFGHLAHQTPGSFATLGSATRSLREGNRWSSAVHRLSNIVHLQNLQSATCNFRFRCPPPTCPPKLYRRGTRSAQEPQLS